MKCAFVLFSFLFVGRAYPALIVTNGVRMPDAPAWVTATRVEQVTAKIQGKLEWDIHRVTVRWFSDRVAFEKAGATSPQIEAFYRHADGTVNLGPLVTSENFDSVFGHELVHVIFHQKYKRAIPAWLEEGFANYLAQKGSVDYAWLGTQTLRDVTAISHPFKGDSNPRYDYSASTALVEMIASHCSLTDLLQLSVGKKLETYLATYCEIPDVNRAFREWVTGRVAAKK